MSPVSKGKISSSYVAYHRRGLVPSLKNMVLPTMLCKKNPQDCCNSSATQASSSETTPSSSALSFYLRWMIDELGVGPEDVVIDVDNSRVHCTDPPSSGIDRFEDVSMPTLDEYICDDNEWVEDTPLSEFMSSLLSSYNMLPNNVTIVQDNAQRDCLQATFTNIPPTTSAGVLEDDTITSQVLPIRYSSTPNVQDLHNNTSCSTISEDSTINDDANFIFFPDESFLTVDTAPYESTIKSDDKEFLLSHDASSLHPSPTSVFDIRKTSSTLY